MRCYPDRSPPANPSTDRRTWCSAFGPTSRIAQEQYRAISQALPGVDCHYALKPLPDSALVNALAEVNGYFDLCSNGEVDIVDQLNIDPNRCIHTHPIKRDSDIRRAIDYGVKTFVFDNPAELKKFLPYREQVELLLRLSFRSSDAVVDLSWKFGAQPQDGLSLLLQARDLGLKLGGLSFHVGSQNLNPAKYIEAIGFCRKLFNLAALEGISLHTLDIGGGFPVPYLEPLMDIQHYCAPIVELLQQQFPNTRLIAEPGRFIAAPSMVLISSIMGVAERQGSNWYYLDEGLYGSYSGKMYDHCDYRIFPLCDLEGESREHRQSVLAGPTCDSVDVLYDNIMMPIMEPGELLVSPMMGAYTSASATEFNFFPKTTIVVLDE